MPVAIAQIEDDELALGEAVRRYTLRCWSCTAGTDVPTLEAARDLGWRRKRGKWTCPSCCLDPLNAGAMDHQEIHAPQPEDRDGSPAHRRLHRRFRSGRPTLRD